jgi:glucokinase
MAVIAVDLGGTKLASALFTADGAVIQRGLSQLEKRGGREVGSLIRRDTGHLLQHAETHGHHVEAIGICVPGISSSKTGRVWAPNIPGWEDYPLMDEIREAVRPGDISVVVDNDRACSILGEVWQGAARGCTDAIFLAVGTGIGAGILTGGRILRGAHDIAGAIGWSALDRPFRSVYTWCGCFEYHASGEGLVKVAREYLVADPTYRGALSTLESAAISTRDLFEAYAMHDPVAERVLGESIEFWGMATANLVSLFNPEKIIFGGGVFGPALQFLDAIIAEARKWAQPISISRVTLEGSQLGSDAALFGAAFRALQSLQENPREDSR